MAKGLYMVNPKLGKIKVNVGGNRLPLGEGFPLTADELLNVEDYVVPFNEEKANEVKASISKTNKAQKDAKAKVPTAKEKIAAAEEGKDLDDDDDEDDND